MGKNKTDIEAFISAFSADPGGREDLVAGLVAGEGRLLINLPGRGAARRISERLREGPFSAFYDFEMILARTLHPRLAALKLNIMADIRVNDLFDEKYRAYARDAGAAAASAGGIGPLREAVTRMVRREGHPMAVKFCDLVVKWANPGLYRTMRPLEVCVMSMKESRRAGDPPRPGQVPELFDEFTAREGMAAAALLLERMEWDDEVREFVPGLKETHLAGEEGAVTTGLDSAGSEGLSDWQDEDDFSQESPDEGEETPAGESPRAETQAGTASAPKTRTEKYARILKNEYLDMKDPGDGEGIRRLVERIQEKNGKAFGGERAAEIVDEVLSRWSADDTIDSAMREQIEMIREDRRDAVETAPEREEVSEAMTDDAALQIGDEPPETVTAPLRDEPVSNGEMEALLNEMTDAQEPGDETAVSGPDDDSFLLDERPPIPPDGGAEADTTGFLIEDRDTHDEVASIDAGDIGLLIEEVAVDSGQAGPGAESEKVPLRKAGHIPSPGDDDFIIQDEILFQDEPAKKRKTRTERPRKGTRITKIEISGPDES